MDATPVAIVYITIDLSIPVNDGRTTWRTCLLVSASAAGAGACRLMTGAFIVKRRSQRRRVRSHNVSAAVAMARDQCRRCDVVRSDDDRCSLVCWRCYQRTYRRQTSINGCRRGLASLFKWPTTDVSTWQLLVTIDNSGRLKSPSYIVFNPTVTILFLTCGLFYGVFQTNSRVDAHDNAVNLALKH